MFSIHSEALSRKRGNCGLRIADCGFVPGLVISDLFRDCGKVRGEEGDFGLRMSDCNVRVAVECELAGPRCGLAPGDSGLLIAWNVSLELRRQVG
jgi:hypothetical protein